MIHIVAGVFLRGSKFLFENYLIFRILYFATARLSTNYRPYSESPAMQSPQLDSCVL